MPGVAINGSIITPSVKNGHVLYDVYIWDIDHWDCVEYDLETGECIREEPHWMWVYDRTESTNAKITGTVSASSKMRIGGVPVAVVGDITNEQWVADPPVPSSTSTTDYRNIRPGTSGSGQGTITLGSSKLRVGGKAIALIGSQVTTHLGTTTTISTGNSKINVAS